MSAIVFDASALLAMLNREPGGDMVAEAMHWGRISAVNYAEVVSYFARAGVAHQAIAGMLDPLPVDVISADKALATLAGSLRAKTADFGLSLGDRFCLAQALKDGLPAWTADRAWTEVAKRIGVEVVLIR